MSSVDGKTPPALPLSLVFFHVLETTEPERVYYLHIYLANSRFPITTRREDSEVEVGCVERRVFCLTPGA